MRFRSLIAIPLAEIDLTAVRSQGAGGQTVNKVASAIHLRFDIRSSASLPDEIRDRLLQLKDRRITDDGVLVIKSQQHRTQERNRKPQRKSALKTSGIVGLSRKYAARSMMINPGN